MEIIVGVIILVCILAITHYTQRSTQELKKLNDKIDEMIKVSKDSNSVK